MQEKTARQAIGLRMNKDLWHQVKIEAVKQNRTCGELVEDLLRDYLGQKPPATESQKPKKSAPAPGIDQAEVERFVLERGDQKAGDLADELNRAGYRTARGKEFNENSIYKIRFKAKQRGDA